ncbi:ParB/RepB/Spo0J family partition protein [Bradyrhizobium oligotrophicum]|uniref:ParB/RepB/Spo0J family partition protein n=1 Tax=Bradyrhizobium oligotrophicum TaxID=44255 RepID=UPI003EBBFC1D
MSSRQNIPTTGSNLVMVPLAKLKKSPKNVRKMPHSLSEIDALAASIASLGVLQYPIVEPETDGKGKPTGAYLVNAGEGRRLAQLLRAKRKEIRKDEPIPCILDTTHNATEISLAENAIRASMHPADEFEAFAELHNAHGMSAEDIAARFGVTASVVKQRLKLGAVSPALLTLYRGEEINLEQLTAFAITDDHARQEDIARAGVFIALGHRGDARIARGYLRPEDRLPEEGDTPEGNHPRPMPQPAPGTKGLSAALVADLTAHRTMAMRNDLAQAPELALVALTHALASRAFGYGTRSCPDITVREASLTQEAYGIEESLAGSAVAARHASWAERMPEKRDELWSFIAALAMDELVALLAHCVSLSMPCSIPARPHWNASIGTVLRGLCSSI